jgi:hypothetical protein
MRTARGIWVLAAALAAAALAGGCLQVNVPDKVDVNINNNGSRGGSSDDDSDSAGQLPDSSSAAPSFSNGGTRSVEIAQAADSSDGGWQDLLIGAAEGFGGLATGMEHGVLFYAFDTMSHPGQAVDLTARMQGRRFGGLEGAELGFYRGEDLIGKAETNDDGYAKVSWTPEKAGDYEFEVKVLSPPDDEDAKDATKVSPAPLLVAARDKKADLAVIDLDHTVVDSSFLWVLVGGANPMPGAADVVKKLAERYTLVYLTHRPDILTRTSKQWLTEHGFPRAPVMVSELMDVFGDSGKFKTARLKSLRKTFPNIRVGIGDKLSDAQAYVDNGLTAYLIPHYKQKPKDMSKMAGEIEALRGRGRLHVVDGWNEIETGVFKGRTYPPDRFARKLRLEADRLRLLERLRDDDEDDDDD